MSPDSTPAPQGPEGDVEAISDERLAILRDPDQRTGGWPSNSAECYAIIARLDAAEAALSAEKEAREIAERRNMLNPSATEYVAELEAARDAALAEVERLREALREPAWGYERAMGVMRTVKANVNKARERAAEQDKTLSQQWLNVEVAVDKALKLDAENAPLATTPRTGIEGVTNQEVDEFLKENRGAATPEEPGD